MTSPHPAGLGTGAHRRRYLAGAGVGRRELESPRWRASFHGYHAWAGTDPAQTWQRVAEVAAILPDGAALTGWAAAFVHGAHWLDGRAGEMLLPVPVALPPRLRVRRGPAIRPIRSALEPDELVVVKGMVVPRVERAAFDLARFTTPQDALVGLDAMLRFCGLDLTALAAYVEERRGWRGVRVVRGAIAHADGRVRSPGESRLRYVWLVEAALPRPQVNVELWHEDGWLLGLPDLLGEEVGLVGEYDGADHRDVDRHAADNAREEGFENAGLVVVRAASPDMRPARRPALVHRLLAGWAAGRALARSRRRWVVAMPGGRHG